jgi:hypothetical protein
MKKTLSIIIAIAMIAAMALPMGIFASADAPQEFATWDEIAAAANDNYGEGNYKLTADSAATVSIDGFFGTFDGGNHTITSSVTLFVEISGGATIKNFTVNQAKGTDGNDVVFYTNPVASLAAGSSSDAPIWISGVTNNVNVSEHPEDQTPIAGILGYADSENWIYIYNVVNNGNMFSRNQTGGIVGNCGHASGHTYLTIYNAVNNGDVFAHNSYGGGIVGNVNAQLTADFKYCINNGKVCAENDAGGMIGQVYGSAEGTFSYCANSGVIDQNPIVNTETGEKLTGGDKTGAKYGAAGICPRFSNANTTITIDHCVIMGVMDNDSNADGSATSSADPFNGWAKDGQGLITITDSSYLHGMNIVGEYAATVLAGAEATGFTVLDQVACQAAFDAIVNDAPKQAAPVTSGVEGEDTPAEGGDDTTAPEGDTTTAGGDVTTKPAGNTTTAKPADTNKPATTTAAAEEGGCGSSISLAIVAVAAVGAVAIARKKED